MATTHKTYKVVANDRGALATYINENLARTEWCAPGDREAALDTGDLWFARDGQRTIAATSLPAIEAALA